MSAQMKNRLTADRIVLYCARKTNSGESGKRPLLWDLRWCEAEEASAYNRLVSGNEFPTAGRAVVLGCAGVDSYIFLERCMATLTEAGVALSQKRRRTHSATQALDAPALSVGGSGSPAQFVRVTPKLRRPPHRPAGAWDPRFAAV